MLPVGLPCPSSTSGSRSDSASPPEDLYPRGRVRTACNACFKRKSACKVRPNEQSCDRCVRTNIICTWEKGKRPISPKSPDLQPAARLASKLFLFELTDSLANHLLQLYGTQTYGGVHPSPRGLKKIGLNGLLLRSPRIFTLPWSTLRGSDQVLALVCMLTSASISTHSGVIGAQGATLAPYQNEGLAVHPLMWAGKRREDVVRGLRANLLAKAEQMIAGLDDLDPTSSHMIGTTLLALLIDQDDVFQFYKIVEGAFSKRLAGVIHKLKDPDATGARELMRQLLRIPPLCGAVCLLPHHTIMSSLYSALPLDTQFPIITHDLVIRLAGTGPDAHATQTEFISQFRSATTAHELRMLSFALTSTKSDSNVNHRQFWRLTNEIMVALRGALDGLLSCPAYFDAVKTNPGTGPHHFLHVLSSSLWGTLMVVSGFHRDRQVPTDRLRALFDLIMAYLTHFATIFDSFPFWEYNILILKGLPLFFSWFRGTALKSWATENPGDVHRVLPFMRMASFASAHAAELVNDLENAVIDQNGDARWVVDAALLDMI